MSTGSPSEDDIPERGTPSEASPPPWPSSGTPKAPVEDGDPVLAQEPAARVGRPRHVGGHHRQPRAWVRAPTSPDGEVEAVEVKLSMCRPGASRRPVAAVQQRVTLRWTPRHPWESRGPEVVDIYAGMSCVISPGDAACSSPGHGCSSTETTCASGRTPVGPRRRPPGSTAASRAIVGPVTRVGRGQCT